MGMCEYMHNYVHVTRSVTLVSLCNGHYLPLLFVLYKPLMGHVMDITFFSSFLCHFYLSLFLALSPT